MNKNRFAGAFGEDSDDDVQAVQKQTKTQKKKEDRKITEKPVAVATGKVSESKMTEGGFEFVKKDNNQKP